MVKKTFKIFIYSLLLVALLLTSNFGISLVGSESNYSYAVLNKTGSLITDDGKIRLRFDLFLYPSAYGYEKHHVFVIDETDEKFIADTEAGKEIIEENYPHVWRDNPYLTIFSYFDGNVLQEDVFSRITELKNKAFQHWNNTNTSLININSYLDTIDGQKYVPSKNIIDSNTKVILTDKMIELENSLSSVFSSKSILSWFARSHPLYANPDAIDIGTQAIDRSGNNPPSYTTVTRENPANLDGTLDTIELFYGIATSTDTSVATFYVVSGNNLSTRDYEYLGSVPNGSKQTYAGLSINVVTGDYIGYADEGSGRLEIDITGGTEGFWRTTTEYAIPCTNQAFNTYANGWLISLYATGETEIPSALQPPSNFFAYQIDNYTIGLSWTNATGSNGTMVRALWNEYPDSTTNGTLIYYGSDNYTSDNRTEVSILLNSISSLPVFAIGYSAWSTDNTSAYSDNYSTTEMGGNMDISVTIPEFAILLFFVIDIVVFVLAIFLKKGVFWLIPFFCCAVSLFIGVINLWSAVPIIAFGGLGLISFVAFLSYSLQGEFI